ncbi:hypothetical protein CB1_001792008 [Camelus ferus]|nr:hypothetical protein CB1_001792008 [Camelus ferus]
MAVSSSQKTKWSSRAGVERWKSGKRKEKPYTLCQPWVSTLAGSFCHSFPPQLAADHARITPSPPTVPSTEDAAELLDLQHAYHELSRQHQAKTADLAHAHHLMGQSEAEVRKLRLRVEELKQGLHQTEDKEKHPSPIIVVSVGTCADGFATAC